MDLPILFSPSEHSSLIPSLVTIHKDCITIDGTMATFMPPLSDSKMTAWWQQQADQVAAEKRLIVVQFCAFEQTGEKELAGVVMLDMPASETGPFRGTVEKLLVSPRHRRKGIARQLMARLEEEAKKVGRTVLQLDTTIGTPAEHVYPRLGYIEIGRIPKYGYSPVDGSLQDELWFYKDLR